MELREAADPVVVCEGVTRRFRTRVGEVVALDDVDLTVQPGSFTVIAGPSGSGKSTLLGLLACLDRPDAGRVDVRGHDVGNLGRRARRRIRRTAIGIVLPQPSDNLLDRYDVDGNLRWAARVRGAAEVVDSDLLDALGVTDRRRVAVRALSGGEQQRVAVAAVLAGAPSIVVADEPTASLDHESGAALVDALRVVAARGTTVVVATHDPALVAAGDQVVHLDHGRRTS